ncbi:hypothetical protein ACJJTC_005488, partial [Scirpophaga incertulas]
MPSTSDDRQAAWKPERMSLRDMPPSQRSSRSVTPASVLSSAASSRRASPLSAKDRLITASPTMQGDSAMQMKPPTLPTTEPTTASLEHIPLAQRDPRRRERPPPLHTSYEHLEVREQPDVFDTKNRIKILTEQEKSSYARALKRQQDEIDDSLEDQQIAKRRLEDSSPTTKAAPPPLPAALDETAPAQTTQAAPQTTKPEPQKKRKPQPGKP